MFMYALPAVCVGATLIFTASQADAARRHSGRYLAQAEKTQRQAAANVSREDVCKTLAASAQQHGLPIAFFGNLIYQESGLNPRVVSHVGARGIAQFMPGTARLVGLKNPFNPHEALPASARFLRSLLHQFGNNYGLAAAAYNAGPGRIQRWIKRRSILPKETRDYVMTITGERAEHWRSIRGNHFQHRLAKRMPCRDMPQFTHNIDEVLQLRGVVRKALMMMPRQPSPAPQVVAIRSVSFIGSANAAPVPQPTVATVSDFGEISIASADPDSLRIAPAKTLPTASSAAEPAAQPKASNADTSVITNDRAARETVATRTVPATVQTTTPVKPAAPKTDVKEQRATRTFEAPLPRANPRRGILLASAAADQHAAPVGKQAGKPSAKGGRDVKGAKTAQNAKPAKQKK